MMPGYVEQLNFPGCAWRSSAARSHTPRKDYLECTEKYQAQVKINPDGSLANYFCGQPFPTPRSAPRIRYRDTRRRGISSPDGGTTDRSSSTTLPL